MFIHIDAAHELIQRLVCDMLWQVGVKFLEQNRTLLFNEQLCVAFISTCFSFCVRQDVNTPCYVKRKQSDVLQSVQVIFAGCVPVMISDKWELPFEDWICLGYPEVLIFVFFGSCHCRSLDDRFVLFCFVYLMFTQFIGRSWYKYQLSWSRSENRICWYWRTYRNYI